MSLFLAEKKVRFSYKEKNVSGLGFKPIKFILGLTKMISELVSKILLI